jgi:site-specific recombinase XerD
MLMEHYEKVYENLKLRNPHTKTAETYVRIIHRFVGHFDLSHEQLGEQHVRIWLAYLRHERNVAPSTEHQHLAAIRYFFKMLGRPEVVRDIPYPKVPAVLHDTLSREEVRRVLQSIKSIKHRTILTATYGAGLRISEACALEFGDVDRTQRVIHVRQGKGSKDRYVMLSDHLLRALVVYYQRTRPPGPCFFPGRRKDRPISPKRPSGVLRQTCVKLGITKRVTTHSFRHAFATHLLEAGTDLRVVQVLLGHSSIRTTTYYTKVTTKHIAQVVSPLDMQEEPPPTRR